MTINLLILTGVALLMAGMGTLACCAIKFYYVDNDKENASLYFFLGIVSLIPEIVYLLILLKKFANFGT